MTTPFMPEIGTPHRFLAVEWREEWEFDHPSVLLVPVFRYSPNSTPLDTLVEDAAIDIALAVEKGEASRSDIHPAEKQEFDWRGWSEAEIRRVAEAAVKGEKVKFGTGYVHAEEHWVVFKRCGDEIEFDYVQPPEGAPCSTG